MAHHGPNPDAVEHLRKMLETARADGSLDNAFGDTGRYPQGQLNKDDEGEIRFGIARDGNKVVVNFGKPVAWIGFDADQAIQIALLLVKEAARIKGVPMSLKIGRDE